MIRVLRRVLSSACAAVLLIGTPTSAHAQCALKVEARPGAVAYQQRPYGCEGLYVQLQSSSLAVQLVSLVWDSLAIPAADVARVTVASALEPGDSVKVFGRGRRANQNWAFDGVITARTPMNWELRQVVNPLNITNRDIGLLGLTLDPNDLAGPVYLPVQVNPTSPRAPTAGRAIEVVLRIPRAGRAQWRLGEGSSYVQADPPDGDGFFTIRIAEWKSGVQPLDIKWSPRGKMGPFGAPERIRIRFP